MKIAIIYGSYLPTKYGQSIGEFDYINLLSQNLASHDCEVFIITSKTKDFAKSYSQGRGVTVCPLVPRWGIEGLFRGDYFQVRKELRMIKPDIIKVIYFDCKLRTRYVLPYFLKFMFPEIPLITISFSPFFLKTSNVLYHLGAFILYLFSNRIYSDDDGGLYTLFRKIFPFLRKKLFFMPTGCNPIDYNKTIMNKTELRRNLGLSDSYKYISFFGFWYRNKGVDILLRAVHLLLKQNNNVKLLLVGGRSREKFNEYDKYIVSLIDDLQISSHVVLTGHCDSSMLVDYMLSSDIAVFPFRYNVLGRSSLMFAISLGLPIIVASSRRSSSGFLINRENIILVKPNDIEMLVRAMEELLKDETLRIKLATNIKKVADQLSWKKISLKWLSIYNEIIKGKQI